MPKNDLNLEKPMMNAAGTLGFSPDPKSPVDYSRMGAFVTNPVSLNERTPARGERYIPFAGGFLLHTGHPNSGLSKVIQQHARRWSKSAVPVIVNLLAQDAISIGRMVQRLEGVDSVMGVEISFPPDIDPDSAYEMAVAAVGELPVILRVPFESSLVLAEIVAAVGISAISLSAPRGALADKMGELVSGRLYGPAIFPQALVAIQNLASIGIPIIGAGGVYHLNDVTAMLSIGAIAVQLDAVLWQGGINNEKIIA